MLQCKVFLKLWLTPKPASLLVSTLTGPGRQGTVNEWLLLTRQPAAIPQITSTKSETHSPSHSKIGNLICNSTRTIEGR